MSVLMLADTVEAACRSLPNPTAQRLEKFIDTLVQAKYDTHQLENADLTFSDLTRIKAAFVQVLTGFYHSRVQYPGQKDPDARNSQAGQGEIEASSGERTAPEGETPGKKEKEKKVSRSRKNTKTGEKSSSKTTKTGKQAKKAR